MDKKEYLVIGSNNFWYATVPTLKLAKDEAKAVMKGSNEYADEESGHRPNPPETIYIYEALEVERRGE